MWLEKELSSTWSYMLKFALLSAVTHINADNIAFIKLYRPLYFSFWEMILYVSDPPSPVKKFAQIVKPKSKIVSHHGALMEHLVLSETDILIFNRPPYFHFFRGASLRTLYKPMPMCKSFFCLYFLFLQKLDGVGPVDNRPSTD